MTAAIYTGSAAQDAPGNRGWLLGHFMPDDDVRHSKEVEIKWGIHPRGDERAHWVTGETRTALIILVRGRFRLEFHDRSVLLAEEGDYVVFTGVDHSWFAEEESIIVGVRWPSVPGYAVQGAQPAQPAQLGHKDLVRGAAQCRVPPLGLCWVVGGGCSGRRRYTDIT